MKQLYIAYILMLSFLLFSHSANAQASKKLLTDSSYVEVPIEGLSIYPNPTSGQTVYISTLKDEEKIVDIFNVLGKNILSANLTGKELNISSLEPGIYIMKIQEGKQAATRKLVIR